MKRRFGIRLSMVARTFAEGSWLYKRTVDEEDRPNPCDCGGASQDHIWKYLWLRRAVDGFRRRNAKIARKAEKSKSQKVLFWQFGAKTRKVEKSEKFRKVPKNPKSRKVAKT